MKLHALAALAFLFPAIPASSVESQSSAPEVQTVESPYARDIARAILQSPNYHQPILFYEGTQQKLESVADHDAMEQAAARTPGLFNGTITKWIEYQYQPIPASVHETINSQPSAADKTSWNDRVVHIIEDSTPFAAINRRTEILFIQDAKLSEMKDDWPLNRELLPEHRRELSLGEALEILQDHYLMEDSKWSTNFASKLDQTQIVPGTNEANTVRDLMTCLALYVSNQHQKKFMWNIMPAYQDGKVSSWFPAIVG